MDPADVNSCEDRKARGEMEDLIEFLRPHVREHPDPDRYRGVLLGIAVGNALGIRTEGWSAAEIRRLLGRITEISPVERTAPWDDDVAQAVILAEAILEHGRLDIHDLGRRFLEWFGDTPRGIGLLTSQVMRELAKRTPASDVARAAQLGRRLAETYRVRLSDDFTDEDIIATVEKVMFDPLPDRDAAYDLEEAINRNPILSEVHGELDEDRNPVLDGDGHWVGSRPMTPGHCVEAARRLHPSPVGWCHRTYRPVGHGTDDNPRSADGG